MPILDDKDNPASSNSKLTLVEVLNSVAFILKKITGKDSWKVPPDISLADLAQNQGEQGDKGDKGDKGDTGAQGVQGEKGDKGDTGESAPLNHQHQIADVSGLQTALDAKSPTGHQHQIAQVEGLQTALDSKSAINIITSATQPSNPNQGLIWNELNSNNNLVEVWRYVNGFWWSEEKLFNVFTPTNTSGVNYYLAMNPAYNYFIKSAHLLFETASTSNYSSVFNFLFQHNKGAGFISTPFTQSFNITAYGTFASIFFVNTKVTSTTDAHQNLRFLLTRTSGSNLIIPSLAIYYHLIRK